MSIDQIIAFLQTIGPYVVAIAVPWFTLHKTAGTQKTLKEMEVEKDERIQRRQIEYQVMIKSLDTLQNSFYHLRSMKNAIACCQGKDDESLRTQYSKIQEATNYWETNYCYLPKSIREQFVSVTNYADQCFNQDLLKYDINTVAEDKISRMFEQIKALTSNTIDEYNPLSKV